MYFMRKLNKKGQDLVFPIVIFLVINLAFFSIMMLFVQRVSSGAILYEEVYAKKIGLILNRAEPGMEFKLNVTDLVNIALENKIDPSNLNSIIQINTEKGIVSVKARPEGGFNYPYFSKVKLDSATTRLGQVATEGGVFFITVLK